MGGASSGRNLAAARGRLRHISWIGGGSGAGKSTIAWKLAAEFGFRIYDTDKAMSDHGNRTSPEQSPFLKRFVAMDIDERWVNRSPEEMLETFHWFLGEGFDLIVDDLLALPAEPPVIVEGFRLLPALVEPLLADPGRAVWLLATPQFRRTAFERRSTSEPPWAFVNQTSDPAKALANLLERDRMFTDRIREESRRLGLRVIEVGPGMTEDDTAVLVRDAFAPWPP